MANHSINPFGSEQPKGKHFISQQQAVLHAFFPSCKTMKMVAVETNVMRSNITKYVSDWKALGKIEKKFAQVDARLPSIPKLDFTPQIPDVSIKLINN